MKDVTKIEAMIVIAILAVIIAIVFGGKSKSRGADASIEVIECSKVDGNLFVTEYKGIEYIWSIHGGILRVEQ